MITQYLNSKVWCRFPLPCIKVNSVCSGRTWWCLFRTCVLPAVEASAAWGCRMLLVEWPSWSWTSRCVSALYVAILRPIWTTCAHMVLDLTLKSLSWSQTHLSGSDDLQWCCQFRAAWQWLCCLSVFFFFSSGEAEISQIQHGGARESSSVCYSSGKPSPSLAASGTPENHTPQCSKSRHWHYSDGFQFGIKNKLF